MLDSLPLIQKLEIAQMWLRRTEAGEFEASPRNRAKFAELVRQCADEAAALVPPPEEHQHPVPADVYVPEEYRPQGFLQDMAVASPVVIAFPKGGAR